MELSHQQASRPAPKRVNGENELGEFAASGVAPHNESCKQSCKHTCNGSSNIGNDQVQSLTISEIAEPKDDIVGDAFPLYTIEEETSRSDASSITSFEALDEGVTVQCFNCVTTVEVQLRSECVHCHRDQSVCGTCDVCLRCLKYNPVEFESNFLTCFNCNAKVASNDL